MLFGVGLRIKEMIKAPKISMDNTVKIAVVGRRIQERTIPHIFL